MFCWLLAGGWTGGLIARERESSNKNKKQGQSVYIILQEGMPDERSSPMATVCAEYANSR